MPLASSGSLTLNEIHVEAGDFWNAYATINDSILNTYKRGWTNYKFCFGTAIEIGIFMGLLMTQELV